MDFENQVVMVRNEHRLLGRVGLGVVGIARNKVVDDAGALAVEAVKLNHGGQAAQSPVVLGRSEVKRNVMDDFGIAGLDLISAEPAVLWTVDLHAEELVFER